MAIPKILVIPGSLRANSHNGRLAALAAKELMLAGADVTRISLADYPLPIYDADVDAKAGVPHNATQRRAMSVPVRPALALAIDAWSEFGLRLSAIHAACSVSSRAAS